MKKHLNTLFVSTQGAYLAKDGETVAVKLEGKVRLRIPLHTLSGIVCFGNVGCSPFLMGFCGERDVALSFLTEYGRFLSRVEGPVSGNVLLRRQQYRYADDQHFSARCAEFFLIGKILNCRSVLKRLIRDHGEKICREDVECAVSRLTTSLKRLQQGLALDQVRGVEGDAAHVYFGVFDQLIIKNKDEFSFTTRSKRPPLDRVNCLLSFLYTLLSHDVRSALECVGLDPAVGFLHRDRPGRYGLALDLMEEFRPFADRIVLSLINRGQLKGADFSFTESGAVRMKDEARKVVLNTYQGRKREEIHHPFIDEKMQIGVLFHTQALLLARYIRGDIDGYPSMIWR